MAWVPAPMRWFKSPDTSLGKLDAESTGQLIAAATDLAFVVDRDGRIRDVAFQTTELAGDLADEGQWIGRNLAETVTVESRPKIAEMLREARPGGAQRWRQVNHPSPKGVDVPVLYSAMEVGRDKRILVFGRDLRTVSNLQRRLLDAQHAMERDYTRLREVESRYRVLFRTAPDSVLVVDAITQAVVEANPAAASLLGVRIETLPGRALPELFDAEGLLATQALLAGVRAGGRADQARARLASDGRDVLISASLFRQEETPLFLVRLAAADAPDLSASLSIPHEAALLRVVEHAPDGFVVTDAAGRIVFANSAFLDMAELGSLAAARHERLDRWIGNGSDLDVITANLRGRGVVRLFPTRVSGEGGHATDVEISAVAVTESGQTCFGFVLRDVGRRLAAVPAQAPPRAAAAIPRSVEQLTELIGRVPLKELVRESTDMIERLCIQAALELTGDNRASAAEMLGLSRQSLYVKLRRYGLGDLGDEPET